MCERNKERKEGLLEKTDVLLNYETERRWRAAVEQGDFQMARRGISQMSKGEFFYRTPDNPLRSQKNLLFTVNTICRIAAVDGGADVVRVHGSVICLRSASSRREAGWRQRCWKRKCCAHTARL